MSRTKGRSLGPVVLLTCTGLVAGIMALIMADLLTRPAAAEQTGPEPVYAVRNLGTLGTDQPTPGAGTSIARDINDSGQVTGQSQSPSGNQGFLWEDGKGMKPIGTLGGLTSPARGINKYGQVVGFSRISSLDTNTQVRAYRWEKEDPPTDLGTLDGFSNSEAWHINDSGVAVGRAFNSTTDGRAVLWEKGQTTPVDLSEALKTRFSETAYSEAWSINDDRQVVGEVGAADQQAKAFLYDKGTNQVTDIDASLDRLVFPYPFSEAAGINDAGQVIGWSYRTGPNPTASNPEGKAFLYERDTDGTPTVVPLEPVVGKPYSRARDIDEEGRVVGWSRSSSGTQAQQFSATLWKDGTDGKPTDLNDLIPASERWDPIKGNPTGGDSGWKLTDAYAINENGQIVGAGFYYHKDLNGKVIQSQLQAFLLTPKIWVSHKADGSNGWNKTSSVTLKVSASDSGSSLDGAPACTEGATNLTLTAGSTTGTWTANVSGEGTHSISCSVTDKTGSTASASDTVKIDTQAVSSLASANSYSNSSPITVNYNTTNAAADTSGLAKVELWVKGPNEANFMHSTDYENTTASGSFSYPVTQDGTYSFYTIAEDNAGNREVIPATGADAIVTVIHDTVAPTLTVSHTGANDDGWNNSSPVTLNVAASDSGSGLDGAPTCTDTTTSGTTSLTLTAGNTGEWTASVSGEGTHTVKCSVSDKAGNPSSEKQDTVKLDKTPPSFSSCSVSPSTLSLPANNHKLVTITASVSLTDGGSGVDGFTLVSVTSNQADSGLARDDVPNDIQGWKDTPDDTSGQLRAERYGGTRTYTLTYRGSDVAGNTKDCSATVTVPKGG
jgi:probable HAF family extracellular repeat protein